MVVTQSTSPLHARKAFLCINRTMQSAGLTVLPFHNAIPTMGEWSWALGMRADVVTPDALRDRVRSLDFSDVETEFLNHEAMDGLVRFWKGIWEGSDEISINTELEPVIDRYYREADWGTD